MAYGNWRRYAGRAAGAAQGFMHGNIPGAVAGYKIGGMLGDYFSPNSDNMAKRKRSSGVTSYIKKSTKKRRAVKRRAKKRSKGKYRAPTQYTAGVKKYKAKSVRQRRNKKAKVSKKMANAIKSVIAVQRPKGEYSIQYLGGGVYYSGFTSNNQLYIGGIFDVVDGGGWHFSVDQIINSASICFNGANWAAGTTKLMPTMVNRLAANTKLTVGKCYSKYKLLNASDRMVTVTAYEIAPREEMPINFNDYTTLWTLTAANTYTASAGGGNQVQTFADELNQAYVVDARTNTLTTGAAGYPQVATGSMNTSPSLSKTFMKKFKCQALKTFTLEAYQDGELFVDGPGGFNLNLNKCFDKSIYNNIQKYSRQIIFKIQLGKLFSTTAYGFSNAPSSVSGGGLSVDRTDFYSFTAPENSTAGVKDVRIFDTEINVGGLLTLSNVNDETVQVQ